MAGISWGVALSSENVAKVAVASSTADFFSEPVFIEHFFDSSRNCRIKAWPARAGIEFCFGLEKGGIATSAGINPFFLMLQILPRKRGLSPTSFNNLCLSG